MAIQTIQAASGEIDVEFYRTKYAEERAKRLRKDGIKQYVGVFGQFGSFDEDPWADPEFARDPVTEEIDAVVVGGGLAGLCAGARLKEAGINDFRMIEKGGDFGGVWYFNRFPGAQCDIESYCYLPLLEETNYIPKEKYSYQPEIFEHCQRIANQYGLYDRALLQTSVTEARWLEDAKRWKITTSRGDTILARFVIQTTGTLDRPKLPGVSGILAYKGHTFHTSRWDFEYTGGDTTGGLDKLRDKRVALVGTGATAIQAVPFLGEYARQLYVIQRTPSSVGVRGNCPTDPVWAKSLQPGWQLERQINFVRASTGLSVDVDMVNDGWTVARRTLGSPTGGRSQGAAGPSREEAEILDIHLMNQRRERIQATVKDNATAEDLKPWYRYFCKRPTFNDEYLPTFNRPNVRLLADPRGLERVTENTIFVGGVEYDVDCIIFASGFEVGTSLARRHGFEFHGRNGRTLSDEWDKSFKTVHGVATNGFPNLLHVGLNQNGASLCITCELDGQAQHNAWILRQMQDQGKTVIEPTREAEDEWREVILSKSPPSDFQDQCTPGYFNFDGNRDSGDSAGMIDEVYGDGPIAFREQMEAWRKAGDMKGFVLT